MKLLSTIIILLSSLVVVNAQKSAKQSNEEGDKKGVASYYHPKFEGRKTANGEVFKHSKYTAACNRLKLGTYIKVTNLSNNQVVYVKINDRLAPNNKRIVDLTDAAAEQLNFKKQGLAKVTVEIVSEEEGRAGILAQRDQTQKLPNNVL